MNFPHPNKATSATKVSIMCEIKHYIHVDKNVLSANGLNNADATTIKQATAAESGASLRVGSFNFSPARNKTRLIPWLREKQYHLAGHLSMVNSILPPTMHAHASDGLAPSWLMCSQGLMLCSGFGGGFIFSISKHQPKTVLFND